jgi:hypothetical protein
MSQTAQTAVAIIGIDIGKNSFHIVGHDERGAIVAIAFLRIELKDISLSVANWIGADRQSRLALHPPRRGERARLRI